MIEKDDIPENWQLTSLGEFIESNGDFLTDGDWIESDDMNEDGEIGIVQLGQIKRGSLLLDDVSKYITEKWAKENNCTVARGGDIVISRMSPVLGGAIVPEYADDFVVPVDAMIARGLDSPTREFLLYYLNSPYSVQFGENMSKGATRTRVSQSDARELPVPVPPLDEQEHIVEGVKEKLERVERLDKSVENISRLSNEYDQSLVLSLMTGGIEKQPSVPPESDDVPEDWEVVNIKDVAQVETGGTPKTSIDEYWDGGITWIRVSDMPDGMYVSESEDKITQKGLKEGSCSLIPEGGVVLSTRATIGEVAIADKKLATNQGFKSIIPESELDSKYLAYYLDSITKYLQSLGKGATYDEINKGQVQNINIPLPPLEQQEKIMERVQSFDSERLRVAVESVDELFDEYRESVLSYAFQGKVGY